MKHATTHTAVSRSGLPPLLPEVARRLLAGLRSPKPERKRQTIEALLAAGAFAAGFVQGADAERARRRHVVDPQRIAEVARGGLGGGALPGVVAAEPVRVVQVPHAALDATAPPPSAPRSNARPRTPRPRTCAIGAPPSPQLTLI